MERTAERLSRSPFPPWAAPAALFDLVDELRTAGYSVGADHRGAVQDVALALVARGDATAAELGELIGPVVCSSAEEQDDFPRRFERWAARVEGRSPEPEPTSRRAAERERQIAEIDRGARRWDQALIAAAIVVVGVLLWVFFGPTSEAPDSVEETPPEAIEAPDGETDDATEEARPPDEPELGPVNPPPPGVLFDELPEPAPDRRWLWLAGGITLLGLLRLARVLWWRREVRAFLVRRATSDEPEIEQLPIEAATGILFERLALFHAACGLRRRVAVPSGELDVEPTVELSARRGGWLTPVYGRRLVMPEYLALIDRTSFGDPQAAMAHELLDRLKAHGVAVERYEFDSDPRACRPARRPGPPIDLRRLAGRFPEHRLLMFSEGDGLFSPRSGELAPWVEELFEWPERALLSPGAGSREGPRDRALARTFTVLPATVAGLTKLTRLDRRGTSEPSPAAPYPEELRVRPLRWLERQALPAADAAEMLTALRRFLGDAGFYWLSACAVYPAIDWHLTVHLGHRLRAAGEPLLDPQRLATLVRLPWLRHGFLPDWLRARLVSDLPRRRRKSVRAVLEDLLLTAIDPPEDAFELDVAHEAGGRRSRLAGWVLRRLGRRAPDGSPLRDEVFLRFMAGKRPDTLAVALPSELGGFLRADRDRTVALRRIAIAGLTAAAVAVGGYLWMPRTPPPLPPGAMLRLETGMHTARINRIGVDAREQYLVTGSHDKTVRVWDLEDGELLRVLRPPIGEENEGMMYAVALSPSGE
ncbi:MAG: hypothetical protein V3T72_01910, partial [Thermoanaerobaculia bacterium]